MIFLEFNYFKNGSNHFRLIGGPKTNYMILNHNEIIKIQRQALEKEVRTLSVLVQITLRKPKVS